MDSVKTFVGWGLGRVDPASVPVDAIQPVAR